VTLRADDFETPVFCVRCLRDFRGECSSLDRFIPIFFAVIIRFSVPPLPQ
jgi:hypothetical protein